MEIEWLGHSCFKLTESTGTTIITDPYNESFVGYPLKSVAADVVTISHSHSGHNAQERVLGSPLIIDSLGSWEVGGVGISSMLSYHDNEMGKIRGENIIYKFRMDGIDICHLGDIGQECNPRIVESVGAVNILLIPVGGKYTIDAEQAKEYVDYLMPDVVIPMHFKTPESDVDVEKVTAFVKLFDEDQIVRINSKKAQFDRYIFDGDQTKVYLFDDEGF